MTSPIQIPPLLMPLKASTVKILSPSAFPHYVIVCNTIKLKIRCVARFIKQHMTIDINNSLNTQTEPQKTGNPFIPTAFMQFFAVATYTILRQLKDALIISSMPPYLFAWVKVLAVMPASIMFNYMYSRLRQNSPSQAAVITKILYVFLGLFLFFSFVVFPYHDSIQMPWLVESMTGYANKMFMTLFHRACPSGLAQIIQILGSIIGYWAFVLLYATAEVWGSVSVSIIAWGTANDYISAKKSSSVYPLISTLANIGAIIASAIMIMMNTTKLFKESPELFRIRGSGLMLGISLATLLMIYAYKYIVRNCEQNASSAVTDDAKALAKEEAKKRAKNMSFMEAVKSIWRDSYLFNIATMVMAYNIAIACIDITWKDQIYAAFKHDFSKIQSGATLVSGFVTVFISLLFALIGPLMPWVTKAMLTVIMMGVTSIAFFMLVLFGAKAGIKDFIANVFRFADPIQFAVVIGAIQSVAVKSAKYVLFDSSKEQAFAVGDDNAKYVGKAIIDIVCSRLSKSIGGFIQTVLTLLITIIPLFLITPVINIMGWSDWNTWSVQKQISPALGLIVLGIVFMWAISTIKLSRMYEEKKTALGQGTSKPTTLLGHICGSILFTPFLGAIMISVIYFAVVKVYDTSITYVSATQSHIVSKDVPTQSSQAPQATSSDTSKQVTISHADKQPIATQQDIKTPSTVQNPSSATVEVTTKPSNDVAEASTKKDALDQNGVSSKNDLESHMKEIIDNFKEAIEKLTRDSKKSIEEAVSKHYASKENDTENKKTITHKDSENLATEQKSASIYEAGRYKSKYTQPTDGVIADQVVASAHQKRAFYLDDE